MGFGGCQSTVTMVFTHWSREGCFPVSQALGGKCRCLKHFAKGSDTASCQDYEEYEFVECMLEETQIIDLFKHCKLQPHKLSRQYMLANHLSSGYFRILFDNMKNDK